MSGGSVLHTKEIILEYLWYYLSIEYKIIIGFYTAHIRRDAIDHSIVHAHHLGTFSNNKKWKTAVDCFELPQILRGASSSRSIGWLMKISLALMHNPLISCSVMFAYLPGLYSLHISSLSMMLSTSMSICLTLSAIQPDLNWLFYNLHSLKSSHTQTHLHSNIFLLISPLFSPRFI